MQVGVFVLSLALGVLPALAQRSSTAVFDDLARRAEALIDSDPAQAAGLFKQALALEPNWAAGWFYYGASLYQVDRYAEATHALRNAVTLAPGHGTAWAFLGLCEAELNNGEQALVDIRKGIALGLGANQEFETAVRVRAARLLIESAGFDEALYELHPLARLGVNTPAVSDTMGMCALSIPGKLSDLPADRRAVVSLAGRAAWASAGQRPADAAAAYKELLERYPEEFGVRYAYGLYLLETDTAAALAEFQKEIARHPEHWPALVVVASLLQRQGEAEASVATLRQAMKHAPPRFRWLCHTELGRAHLTADNLDEATRELRRALRLKPQNSQVHFLLAQAYRRAGKLEEAQAELAEFQKLKLQLDPLGMPGLRVFSAQPAR